MSTPYGAGIIGAGVIFQDHARAYRALHERVRLVGLADVDEKRTRQAGEQFFIPYRTSDYHELLARDDIQIVNICTPPCLHEEMVTAALDAGKYVICEKPLAQSLAAADRIIAHADKYPGKLSTVYQLRYTPEAKRILWCRDNGVLGDLHFGRFSRYATIEPHQKAKGWWGKWEVGGGGAVMTQCIHELDIMLHVFGPAKRVTAWMETRGHEIESEDTFSATIEFESGAGASCFCSLAGNIRFGIGWEIVGQNAAVRFPWSFDCRDRNLIRQTNEQLQNLFPMGGPKAPLPGVAGKVYNKVKRKIGGGKPGKNAPSMHTPYFAAILDAIDAGEPVPVGTSDARASLELCTAIYTSALTGQPVDLPLDHSTPYYEGVTTEHYDGRQRLQNRGEASVNAPQQTASEAPSHAEQPEHATA